MLIIIVVHYLEQNTSRPISKYPVHITLRQSIDEMSYGTLKLDVSTQHSIRDEISGIPMRSTGIRSTTLVPWEWEKVWAWLEDGSE